MAIDTFYQDKLREYAQKLVEVNLLRQGKPIKEVKPIYVMYVRKSTKGKKHQERSIPDQIKACQELAKSMGFVPVHIFKDIETAKKPNKRNDFAEMLQGIKQGHFNSIIAWHPDRLARNMKDAGEIIDLLDRNLIVDLKFPSYTFVKDANGVMALGIQFVMAKQYSDALSVTSTRGSKNIALEGKATIRTKYGYRLDKNRYYRPDGNNFTLLQQAFRDALDKTPLEIIAKDLNDSHFRYERKRTLITKQKLSKIFRDTFYAGLYVYSNEIIDIAEKDTRFTSMVTPKEFIALRRVFEDARGYKRKQTDDRLLEHLVYCSYCGHLMTPGVVRGATKRYLSIVCSNKRCYRYLEKKRSIKKAIRGKVILDFTINLLKANLNVDKAAYEAYIADAKQELESEREAIMNKIRSVSRKITDTNKDIGEYSAQLKNASEKLIDEINRKGDQCMTDRDKLVGERKRFEQQIVDIDEGITTSAISYDNFLNFFKYLAGIIQNSNNILLVNKVLKMMFLNYQVDDENVVSYQLNPSFAKYVKIDSVILGRVIP